MTSTEASNQQDIISSLNSQRPRTPAYILMPTEETPHRVFVSYSSFAHTYVRIPNTHTHVVYITRSTPIEKNHPFFQNAAFILAEPNFTNNK